MSTAWPFLSEPDWPRRRTGRVVRAAVRQVVGIDLTPALLRLVADRLHGASITNVFLQEDNVNQFPFLDASFDLVVCRSSLHHFPPRGSRSPRWLESAGHEAEWCSTPNWLSCCGWL
jgi:SAM-dependent methyltransferase